MKTKCIIIGSGLGGLACGSILSRNGYDVTILEQGAQIGGCLQCFNRGGARFETGMHFIGSAAPGQTLNKLMNYLNLKDIKLSQLDCEAYNIVSLAGNRFAFANGREAFINQFSTYFPHQRDNLVAYYDIIEKIAQASSLHSLRNAQSDIAVNTYYQTVSINAVLDALFDDDMLKNVLVGDLPLYAGEKNKTPFSQHAFIMNFYNQSSYRIIGGSDQIANAISKDIQLNDGIIRTNSKVTKIICDATHAIGVEVNSCEFLAADVIIAAIHPARIMEMLDTKLIRPAFRERMASLKNTIGVFSVFLKFKPDKVPYLNSNFYSFKSGSPWDCEQYTESIWPKGYLYMHFCHKDNPHFAKSGVILSYMNIKDVMPWFGTKLGKRGISYQQFKQSKALLLLDQLENDFPGIRDNVDMFYTATPLTYLDYTGTQDGSMYGVAKDISAGAACRVPHKTRVPNLFLSGQNINSHGMLGVLVGSIVTCSELITSETIYQQIIASNQ